MRVGRVCENSREINVRVGVGVVQCQLCHAERPHLCDDGEAARRADLSASAEAHVILLGCRPSARLMPRLQRTCDETGDGVS